MVFIRFWVLVRVVKETVLRSVAVMRAGSIPAVPIHNNITVCDIIIIFYTDKNYLDNTI